MIINIGLAIVIILSLSLLYDENFKPDDDCDVTKEHAKLIAEFGKRYHHLSLEERAAFDQEFDIIVTGETQEERDIETDIVLSKYGIVGVWYSSTQQQYLFYNLLHLCSDYGN